MQAVQLPGLCLGVGVVEVSKKGSVRQVKEAGGIISHCVEGAWDVIAQLNITMKTLVKSLLSQDRGRGGGSGD